MDYIGKIQTIAPKKPLSAFFIFSKAKREEVLKSNPDMKAIDLAKVLSQQYINLSHDQKEHYKQLAEEAKENYRRELEEYNEQFENKIFKNLGLKMVKKMSASSGGSYDGNQLRQQDENVQKVEYYERED